MLNRLFKALAFTNALLFTKALLFAFIFINVIGCTSDSQPNPSEIKLTNQEKTSLLLKTKRAILDLDFTSVERLISEIDVNQALPDNSTLLAWAVETQEPVLVNLLLENGAIAEVTTSKNSNRFTAIIQACRYGNAEIIEALLDKGADPNSAIEDGTNAFQLCAGSTSAEVLTRMTSVGANITAENNYGQTALMWAANSGIVDNLNYLVEAGANINQQTTEGYSPLFFAIKSHNLDVVKATIAHGADLFTQAEDGTTAAQLGVYTKNFEFLTWFASELDSLMTPEEIEATLTDFDRDGHQLLHAAVEANQPELVPLLLKLGANPTATSGPSQLKWRYEANFKTEDYIPPQLTAIELAEKKKFKAIAALMQN